MGCDFCAFGGFCEIPVSLKKSVPSDRISRARIRIWRRILVRFSSCVRRWALFRIRRRSIWAAVSRERSCGSRIRPNSQGRPYKEWFCSAVCTHLSCATWAYRFPSLGRSTCKFHIGLRGKWSIQQRSATDSGRQLPSNCQKIGFMRQAMGQRLTNPQ